MLHTLRCSMAEVFCIYALLSHCLVVLRCLVVLPLLLLVRVSICLLPSSVCLLSYLLLLTVGAHPVVPDRSRLCWGSLLRYHVKLTVAMLRHFSLLITCQAQGLCWAQRVEALIHNKREREKKKLGQMLGEKTHKHWNNQISGTISSTSLKQNVARTTFFSFAMCINLVACTSKDSIHSMQTKSNKWSWGDCVGCAF